MRETLPEIYLLIAKGYNHKQITDAGYNRHTVYKYLEKYPEIKRRFQKAKKKIKENRLK